MSTKKLQILGSLGSGSSALEFTPVQQGGGEGQGTNKVYIGWSTDGDGLKAQVDNVDLGYIMTENGNGGLLPIHRGGTGASDAETALSNLGGLPKTGGTLTGNMHINAPWGRMGWKVGGVTKAEIIEHFGDSAKDGGLIFRIYSADGSQYKDLCLDYNDGVTVSVANGGTGATAAAQALSNLGGFSKSGGTVEGSITASKGTEWSAFQNVRTINGEQRDVSMYISGAGDAEFVTGKAGTTVNKMVLSENQTTFMKPVNVASGGTGATTAAAARTNLGIMSGTSLPSSGNEGDIFFLYS